MWDLNILWKKKKKKRKGERGLPLLPAQTHHNSDMSDHTSSIELELHVDKV